MDNSPITALQHDVRRLDLAERDAYSRLLSAIAAHPDTTTAYEAWLRARSRHSEAQGRLDAHLTRRPRP